MKIQSVLKLNLLPDKANLRRMKLNESEIFKGRTSAQIILESCHGVKDRISFLLSNLPCTVAPLKILEALKASHICWSADFRKNIADLHLLL